MHSDRVHGNQPRRKVGTSQAVIVMLHDERMNTASDSLLLSNLDIRCASHYNVNMWLLAYRDQDIFQRFEWKVRISGRLQSAVVREFHYPLPQTSPVNLACVL